MNKNWPLLDLLSRRYKTRPSTWLTQKITIQEFGFDAAVALKAVEAEKKILEDIEKKNKHKDDGKDVPMSKKLEAMLGKPGKGAKKGQF